MLTDGDELNRRLRLARERCGLTQAELAATAKVALNTLKQYESGRIKPGADALAGYARAGISLRYLLLAEGEPLLPDVTYRRSEAAVALQIGEGIATWQGEVPVFKVVEGMLAIAASIAHAEETLGVLLAEPKKRAVAQALFEEYLESGALPRTTTVLRFVKAAE